MLSRSTAVLRSSTSARLVGYHSQLNIIRFEQRIRMNGKFPRRAGQQVDAWRPCSSPDGDRWCHFERTRPPPPIHGYIIGSGYRQNRGKVSTQGKLTRLKGGLRYLRHSRPSPGRERTPIYCSVDGWRGVVCPSPLQARGPCPYQHREPVSTSIWHAYGGTRGSAKAGRHVSENTRGRC